MTELDVGRGLSPGLLKVEWQADLDGLLQNRLLDEADFIRFARDRGLPVRGIGTGDPGQFYERGWLQADGLDDNSAPRFHPFRLYVLHHILEARSLSEMFKGVAEATRRGYAGRVTEFAPRWNELVDLAVLLEPLYWPEICGSIRRSLLMEDADLDAWHERYRRQVLAQLKEMKEPFWKERHAQLRRTAGSVERNDSLYLLLRLSSWRKRERLVGDVSRSLWLRHMAEVIRRGFEDAFDVRWEEEDRTFGMWFKGARERTYGSERPLDRPVSSKPYVAWDFGLFTGSVVRWYVEGATEYHAVAEILPGAPIGGIELIDLRGNIAEEKATVAMRLADGLKQDRSLRRFSIISFDCDVPANVKAVRRQIDEERIVGYVAAHRPDFEFANFSREELVEVAASLDEAAGFDATALRFGDWSGIENARQFEAQYQRLSARMGASLKGEVWGVALAQRAMASPQRSDGTDRPLLQAVQAAMQARTASYDHQAKAFRFDRDSFELVRRDGHERGSV